MSTDDPSNATASDARKGVSNSGHACEVDPIPLHRVFEEEYAAIFGEPLNVTEPSTNSEERLVAVRNRLNERSLGALCISGGGIRSATFALGVLQGLAKRGLLDKFHYMSTVSGGSFLGGWLSAWIHREGIAALIKALAGNRENSEIEPRPIRHLREFSNYLSPRWSLFSADTWTLAFTVLRNLVLNWLVFLPIIAAALLIPRFNVTWIVELQPPSIDFPSDSPMRIPLISIAMVLGLIGVVEALWYMATQRSIFNLPGDRTSDKSYGSQPRFIWWCLLPLLVGAWAFSMTYAWSSAARSIVSHAAGTTPPADGEWWYKYLEAIFIFSTVFLNVVPAFARALRERDKSLKWYAWELLVLAMTGFVGGWLLFKLAQYPWFNPLDHPRAYACFAVPGMLGVFLLNITLANGLLSGHTPPEVREWWARAGGWILLAAVLWWAVHVLVLFVPSWVLAGLGELRAISISVIVSAAVALLGASSTTPATTEHPSTETWPALIKRWLIQLLAPLAIVAIAIALVLGTNWLLQRMGGLDTYRTSFVESERGRQIRLLARESVRAEDADDKARARVEKNRSELTAAIANLRPSQAPPESATYPKRVADAWRGFVCRLTGLFADEPCPPASPPLTIAEPDPHEQIIKSTPCWLLILWLSILLVISLAFSMVVNINKFSLHDAWRNRLARAYLGASHRDRTKNETYDRFTGFNPHDDVDLCKLWYGPAPLFQALVDAAVAAKPRGSGKPNPTAMSISAKLGKDERRLIDEQASSTRDPAWQCKAQDKVSDAFDKFLKVHSDERTALLKEIGADGVGSQETLCDERLARARRLVIDKLYTGTRRGRGPFHIINMALNLVSGADLAWQQRKAESFTASTLHCGSGSLQFPEGGDGATGPSGCGSAKLGVERLGYRSSVMYGGGRRPPTNSKGRPISLSTSIALSGAAVNPNMGYHSSATVAFLMTLFNVRLGAWLGNPGPAGNDSYASPFPVPAFGPMLREAFGMSHARSPYVQLSDGGHFENLGLYEMVRRQCRVIFVSDAGQDSPFSFDDLGNAVRKIYIDMGVRIEFTGELTLRLRPRSTRADADKNRSRSDEHEPDMVRCALARIRYSELKSASPLTDGFIVYVKPTFYGDEPIDVYNYAQGVQEFPHESTADQFFSESQFESYRRLGEFIIEKLYVEGKAGKESKADADRDVIEVLDRLDAKRLGRRVFWAEWQLPEAGDELTLIVRGIGFTETDRIKLPQVFGAKKIEVYEDQNQLKLKLSRTDLKNSKPSPGEDALTTIRIEIWVAPAKGKASSEPFETITIHVP